MCIGKYKMSSIGIIPIDWDVKRVKDFGQVYTGNTPPTSDLSNYGCEFKFVSPADITDAKYIGHTEKGLSSKGFAASRNAEKGAVLFTCIGSTIGKCAIANESIAFNQQINAVVCDENHDAEFLYYELCRSASIIKLLAGEQAVPIVNKSTFENFKVICPSIYEQKEISKLLSLWDNAIEKQTELIEKLRLRKRGLMQQLLTGKKRLPGFTDKWNCVKLKEIGYFFKGSGVPKDSILNKGYKCLTYGDLYTKYDFVIRGVSSFIDDDTAKVSTEIRYGDICFAGSGETKEEIGKCAAFIDADTGYAGGDIIVFRPNDANPICLSYILNTDDVVRQKSKMGQGYSVVHIYPYQLEKITINLPDRKEQDQITHIMLDADKEINNAKAILLSLQYQKRGLMQQLLTGKKRI